MSRVSTASLNTVHQSRYSAAPESTDLFPSSVHLSATGAGGVLKFGPSMQPAPTNTSPKTSEYSCQNLPLIPRSCEKIGGRPSRASGRTVKYLNLHGAIPFVVRLSNHERIFSQIPLCQRRKLQKQREKFFSAFSTRSPGEILVSCSTLNFSSSCSFSHLRGERGAPPLCRRAFRDRPSTLHR